MPLIVTWEYKKQQNVFQRNLVWKNKKHNLEPAYDVFKMSIYLVTFYFCTNKGQCVQDKHILLIKKWLKIILKERERGDMKSGKNHYPRAQTSQTEANYIFRIS